MVAAKGGAMTRARSIPRSIPRAWPVLIAAAFVLADADALAAPVDSAERPTQLTDPSGDDATRTTIARRRKRRSKSKSTSAPAPAATKEDAAVQNATRQGPTRIEFDERLLQGQTNKANAIYLFQRRESALRSLVKKRKHFHDEIDEALE
jgi:hypothetical protein